MILSKFSVLVNKYPIVRGILTYSVIYPSSNVIQQTINGKTWKTYDWQQVLRFGLFGSAFVAPTLYGWVRISSLIWTGNNLKSAVSKAVIEQFTYGPFSLTCFFFGMSILEKKTVDESLEVVKDKFWQSYKVAVMFWPFVQTVNFYYIPEKNRVPFVSVCSLLWCTFLSYMHHIELSQNKKIVEKST